MKKLLLFSILFATMPLFSGAYIEFFTGRSDGENITLEWKTHQEDNVSAFDIERKAGVNGQFIMLARIEPRGSNSHYTYIDKSAFKSAESLYIYRLKILDTDPSAPPSYSQEVHVSHSVSSVKRTWGSIKAMFR
ncbi:MAG: hypothetical protein GXO82_09680 [Chlorobi bacterium]|nr:hypothetical protein [Chlorobiota bacterium]